MVIIINKNNVERFVVVDRQKSIVIIFASNGYVVNIGYGTQIAEDYSGVIKILDEALKNQSDDPDDYEFKDEKPQE